jgi:protein arginine kinase
MRPLEPLHFAGEVGSWLRNLGPDQDVAVSCRVRLARNLAGYPFVTRLDEKRAGQLASRVRDAIERRGVAGGDPVWVDLPEASGLVRLLLRERHLASRDHAPVEERARVPAGRAVVFATDESSSAMVNEEDHLRLQGLSAGFDLETAFREVSELDQAIENEIDVAYSTRLGYLTACPTNVGTGMRASVMLHLPALGMVRAELEKVFAAAHRTGLAVRGMYGEGSRAAGDFYQVSNQITLGRSEEDLLAELRALVPGIVEFERRVRSLLLEQRRGALEDRVARSLGTLAAARMLSTEDALRHLSHVRLGIALGLVEGHDTKTIDLAAIRIQRGHLQARHPDEAGAGLLDSPARDRLRAGYLRTLLGSGSARGGEGTT